MSSFDERQSDVTVSRCGLKVCVHVTSCMRLHRGVVGREKEGRGGEEERGRGGEREEEKRPVGAGDIAYWLCRGIREGKKGKRRRR